MATTISITSGLTATPSSASDSSGNFTIVNNFTSDITVDQGVGTISANGGSQSTTVSSGSVRYTASSSASGQSNVKFTLTKSKGDED